MRFVMWLAVLGLSLACSNPKAVRLPSKTPAVPFAVQRLSGLSDAQARAYLDGHEWGLGKSAELHRFASPAVVLLLVPQLVLFRDQSDPVQAIFDRTHVTVVALGKKLVDEETKIDEALEEETPDPVVLEARIRESARLQGEMRIAHIEAHLETNKLLRPDQRVRYGALRGHHPEEDGP